MITMMKHYMSDNCSKASLGMLAKTFLEPMFVVFCCMYKQTVVFSFKLWLCSMFWNYFILYLLLVETKAVHNDNFITANM